MRQLWQEIGQGVFLPAYIFYGKEPFLLEEALSAVVASFASQGDQWNVEVLTGETATPLEVALAAGASSFLGGRRLVLLKDCGWLEAKAGEGGGKKGGEPDMSPLLEYLAKPNQENCLILLSGQSIDKRRRLAQAVQKCGRIVEFAPLNDGQLTDWIKKRLQRQGKRAPGEVLDHLILSCGNNLHALAGEIDKLVCHSGDNPLISYEEARLAVSQSSLLSVFTLVDAVCAKDGRLAAGLLRGMLKQGEPAQRILSLLARQIHNMMAAQDMQKQGQSNSVIMKELGIPFPFIVERLLRYARLFTPKELLEALELLLAADKSGKSGQARAEEALELAVLRICFALPVT
ncbi:MAG: DNA polymerase III subunit delta [Clostridiales bacterium]|nr:DNA polymerase III subunit delta [Clostridiales bacterium]